MFPPPPGISTLLHQTPSIRELLLRKKNYRCFLPVLLLMMFDSRALRVRIARSSKLVLVGKLYTRFKGWSNLYFLDLVLVIIWIDSFSWGSKWYKCPFYCKINIWKKSWSTLTIKTYKLRTRRWHVTRTSSFSLSSYFEILLPVRCSLSIQIPLTVCCAKGNFCSTLLSIRGIQNAILGVMHTSNKTTRTFTSGKDVSRWPGSETAWRSWAVSLTSFSLSTAYH